MMKKSIIRLSDIKPGIMGPQVIDLTGRIIGTLTIEKFMGLHKQGKGAIWRCWCSECKKHLYFKSYRLLNGRMQTCTCQSWHDRNYLAIPVKKQNGFDKVFKINKVQGWYILQSWEMLKMFVNTPYHKEILPHIVARKYRVLLMPGAYVPERVAKSILRNEKRLRFWLNGYVPIQHTEKIYNRMKK